MIGKFLIRERGNDHSKPNQTTIEHIGKATDCIGKTNWVQGPSSSICPKRFKGQFAIMILCIHFSKKGLEKMHSDEIPTV